MPIMNVGILATGQQIYRPGWLAWQQGTITDSGPGHYPGHVDYNMPNSLVVPGFIDLHCHGGAGVSYSDPHHQEAWAIHRQHGTTGGFASLVSAPMEMLATQIRQLIPTDPHHIDGIHLEGPWINPHYCGAHDRKYLSLPHLDDIKYLLDIAEGHIAMITLAPELPGALKAIDYLVDHGVRVAIGHTDASDHQTRDAIRAGASIATHLFNAMAPIHHRNPGPIPALMASSEIKIELIGDGIHLDHHFSQDIITLLGASRIIMVTDAMAGAGCGDGCYRLGELAVRVTGGRACLEGTDTIAGSLATMDQIFHRYASYDNDALLNQAVQICSTVPASVISHRSCGYLLPGYDADCVVLDPMLCVEAVMSAGVLNRKSDSQYERTENQ